MLPKSHIHIRPSVGVFAHSICHEPRMPKQEAMILARQTASIVVSMVQGV